MRSMPIRYVRDVERARAFYEALGFHAEVTNRPRNWVELRSDDSWIALHGGGSGVELNFEAREPLEQVAARMRSAGHEPLAPIHDEAYGRTLRMRDPDGMEFTITEYDRELYT